MQIPATYAFPTVGTNQNRAPAQEGSAPADRSGKSASSADQVNQTRTPGAEKAQEPQAVASLQSAQNADPASIFAALAGELSTLEADDTVQGEASASGRPPPPPPPPPDEAANTNAATFAYTEAASLFDQTGLSTALQLIQHAS